MNTVKIESSENSVYKNTKKLFNRSERKKTNTFILEGERLVKDALRNGAELEYIMISEKRDLPEELCGVKTYVLSERLFDGLKSTVNSQGILAVARYLKSEISDISYENGGCYLYLDGISDPGNMGTILRTADAFGVNGVIVSSGCVDVYNPKVLRSTMSGIFNIKLYFSDEGILNTFKKNGFKIIGTFPDSGSCTGSYNYTQKHIIVMGNEANGISESVERLCSGRIKIPMTGGAESLNVSVACGIILYDSYMFRTKAGGYE